MYYLEFITEKNISKDDNINNIIKSFISSIQEEYKHKKLITLMNQTYYSHPEFIHSKSDYFPFAFPIIACIISRLNSMDFDNDKVISMINAYFSKRMKYIFKHLDQIDAEAAALNEICDEIIQKLEEKS